MRIELTGEAPDAPEMEKLRRNGLADPPVSEWISELEDWPWPPLKGHKTLALLIHKLAFLADIGLRHNDPAAAPVAAAILEKASPEGPFRIPILIPKAFGGSGEVEEAWILTDAPIIVGALARMGLADHPKVITAATYLEELVRDNGWPCAADPVLGRFRGPGRKDDSCPYATLITLRMLSEFPGEIESGNTEKGIESLLNLWEEHRERRPYMFGMGRNFLKLKAPFVWFDVLHFLEVLSRFPRAHRDPRFLEILKLARDQSDEEGRYTAASIYRPAAGFDFGGKKEASRWITFVMRRIDRRISEGREPMLHRRRPTGKQDTRSGT